MFRVPILEERTSFAPARHTSHDRDTHESPRPARAGRLEVDWGPYRNVEARTRQNAKRLQRGSAAAFVVACSHTSLTAHFSSQCALRRGQQPYHQRMDAT